MEHSCLFEERVSLTPRESAQIKTNINDKILEKVKEKLEGKCSRNGYVIPGTLELLSRSMGQIEKGTFTGDWVFIVQAQGTVIYPPDGTVMEAKVSHKNKAGLYLIYKDAVRIFIPRDLYIGDEEYESVVLNDTIKVEIKKSRFQVNDKDILSVGLFRGKVVAGMISKESEESEEESEEEEAAEAAEAAKSVKANEEEESNEEEEESNGEEEEESNGEEEDSNEEDEEESNNNAESTA